VLCPAFTFQATACAILGAGCHPVIVDVHPAQGVVSPEMLDEALTATGARDDTARVTICSIPSIALRPFATAWRGCNLHGASFPAGRN
jgi:hypothetical protein